jgi:hypothetical protein
MVAAPIKQKRLLRMKPDVTTGTPTPTTGAPSAPSTESLASSSKLRAFVVTFAIAGPILYLVCSARNLPLITYHPAMNRIDLGWTAARSGEGPAMYWYGWTLTTLVSGAIVSFLATLLPERVTRRIPLYLVWILPVLTVPLLAYSLRAFWLHP